MNQIHGHEVMRMMVASGQTYTRETLHAAILERFGPETRFHTCSMQGMNAGELIDFLAAKGKFVIEGQGFATTSEQICDHE